MNSKFGLLKINNSTLIKTEVFQSQHTADISSLDKYSAFFIGEEAYNKLEYATKKNLHYYKYMKKDLVLSPSLLSKNMQKWKCSIANKNATKLRTNLFGEEYLNPGNITEIYLFNLISHIIEVVKEKISKDANIKFSFTQPAYESGKRINYSNNFSKILDNIKTEINSKKDNHVAIELNDLDKSKLFFLEQYAVYYFYAGFEKAVEYKKSGNNYLLIDSGASTTDVAIIRITQSEGDFPRSVHPKYESVEIGGADLDEEIFKIIAKRNNLKVNKILEVESKKLLILSRIEKSKIALLENEKTVWPIIIEGKKCFLKKEDVEEAFKKLWRKIKPKLFECIKAAMKASKAGEFNFDKVFLSGGMSKLSYFKETIGNDAELNAFLKNCDFIDSNENNIHPSNIAALGLAFQIYAQNPEIKFKYDIETATSIIGKFVPKSEHEYKIQRKKKSKEKKLNKGHLFSLEEFEYCEKNKQFELNLDRNNFTDIITENYPNELEIFLKTDLDHSFQDTPDCKINLTKGKIRSNKVQFSCKLERRPSWEKLKFNFHPYFYLGNNRWSKEEGTNEFIDLSNSNSKVEYKSNDLFVCIDFGMSNTSVGVYSPYLTLPEEDFDVFTYSKLDEDGTKWIESDKSVGSGVEVDNGEVKKIASEDEGNKGLGVDEGEDKESETSTGIIENSEIILFFNETNTIFSNGLNRIVESIDLLSDTIDGKSNVEEDRQKEESIVQYSDIYQKLYSKIVFSDSFKIGYTNSQELLDSIIISLNSQKRLYDLKVLESCVSQITNPKSGLTVISGPPGVGKSSLVRILVNAIYSKLDIKSLVGINPFINIPVSPAWLAPDNLLGGYNYFTNKPVVSDFTSQLLLAKKIFELYKDNSPPVVVCLDEFNIAQPELYLSDVLSAMEQDEPTISLVDYEGRYQLPIPPNFKIFATINTDGTSKSLSPKVLDRSTFIRLDVNFETLYKRIVENKKLSHGNNAELLNRIFGENAASENIFRLSFEAAVAGGSFISFRTIDKIFSFLENYPSGTKSIDVDIADSILASFLLPKLPAYYTFEAEQYGEALKKLQQYSKKQKLKKSERVLTQMINLKTSGQIS
jgi:Hsp70 protein